MELREQEAQMHRDLIAVAEKHMRELDEDSRWWGTLHTLRRVSRDALERAGCRHLEAVR